MSNIELATKSIQNFSLDESEYSETSDRTNIIGSGKVFVKDSDSLVKVSINFTNTKGGRVFLGRNLNGKVKVIVKGNDSVLFIGDNCSLTSLTIRSIQNSDFIAIGNHILSAGSNLWVSGNGAGQTNPAIIIGDDCMFSFNVVIRNSDAHPIFDLESGTQINQPSKSVFIEPHVWVGQQVTILKSVTIGACSIVGLGSIVTKDVPRFSIATGVPAISKVNKQIFWAKDEGDLSKNIAKSYTEKYLALSS
ncbi:acyltransferase [Paraglaciecola marina]|uniref:acyltransferase n=1 Tax=Paraglaciecola marina TaxID=2500157 RepID=UPI00105EC1CF|nr:acyltransferase [Paraglaciecola marina]